MAAPRGSPELCAAGLGSRQQEVWGLGFPESHMVCIAVVAFPVPTG